MKKLMFNLVLIAMCATVAHSQDSKMLLTNATGDLLVQSRNYSGDFQLNKEAMAKMVQWDIDPGMPPEGDYMGDCTFTPDGGKVILTNKRTNNVTIWDWDSMDLLANVSVGEYPSCVGANNAHAIVGCQFSDSVYIIDLATYTIDTIFATGEQPCSIEISPDGNLAYVACDISNTCMAIELNAMVVVGQISNFPIYLQTFSWAVQVSRNWEKYNDFVVLADGASIAITDPDSDDVVFFSTNTYQEMYRVAIATPRAIAISGDGNYLACASNPDNECIVHQIDLLDLSVTASVPISGYGLGSNDIVVNHDGSKAYIGTTNNSSTLVRFETQDFVNFTGTYTAFWLGVSPDHTYAVSGQNRFSIIDFEMETIADQHLGLNQSFGTVSPVGNHVFAYDPLRFEGAYFFDFTDPEDIEYRGYELSGEAPEGDCPGAVAINLDRTKALAAGNLSYNCPIIDLMSLEATSAVPVEESPYDVKITPDGQWAVAGGYNLKTVKIIDLTYDTLATTIYTGDRPMIVEMAPDGQHAYIGNIKQNTLSVVALDGPNSSLVTSKPCGVIGVYIPFFGIRSAVRVSPDGSTVLVAASFDDELNVFDTETNTFVASLPTGDFPLDVAFNADGTRACVVNTFDNSFDIVSIDGASSSVLYHNGLNGDYPMDVAYNYTEDLFYICSASGKRIFKIEPGSGEVKETIYTGLSPFHIEFHGGASLIQYQGDENSDHKIVYAEFFEYILPAAAAPFNYNEYSHMVGAAIPGPDYISLIELGPPPFIAEQEIQNSSFIFPNPARDVVRIKPEIKFDKVQIYSTNGDILLESFSQVHSIDISGLQPGAYVVRITSKKLSMSSTLIVE